MEFKDQYGVYKRVSSGKVREIYENEIDGSVLLVATDRMSALDRQLEDEIPDKGKILTAISTEMFVLAEKMWGLPTAFIWGGTARGNRGSLYVEEKPDERIVEQDDMLPAELRGRITKQKKLEMFKVECIVRGHISGSAWKAYESGEREICGVPLPEGLVLGQKLPKPIFTPTTKAPVGEHDENITFGEMTEIIGDKEAADQVYCLSLEMFECAYRHLLKRGIILADTKFELGVDSEGNICFGDELLTPDSSRYWDAKTFVPGARPLSYDKQIVRDFLAECDSHGMEINWLPYEIVKDTYGEYAKLHEIITGDKWQRSDTY